MLRNNKTNPSFEKISKHIRDKRLKFEEKCLSKERSKIISDSENLQQHKEMIDSFAKAKSKMLSEIKSIHEQLGSLSNNSDINHLERPSNTHPLFEREERLTRKVELEAEKIKKKTFDVNSEYSILDHKHRKMEDYFEDDIIELSNQIKALVSENQKIQDNIDIVNAKIVKGWDKLGFEIETLHRYFRK